MPRYYFVPFLVFLFLGTTVSAMDAPLALMSDGHPVNADYINYMKGAVERDLENNWYNPDYTPIQKRYYKKLCAKKSGSLSNNYEILWQEAIKEYGDKKNILPLEKTLVLAATGLVHHATIDLIVRKSIEYAQNNLGNKLLHAGLVENFWDGTLTLDTNDLQNPYLAYKANNKQLSVTLEAENRGDQSPRLRDISSERVGTEKFELTKTVKTDKDPVHSSLKSCRKVMNWMYKESYLTQKTVECERLLQESRERETLRESERYEALNRVNDLEKQLKNLQGHYKKERYYLKKRNALFYGLGITSGVAIASVIALMSKKFF